MKALIKKDLYLIRSNIRTLVPVLALLAALQIPGSGPDVFIYTCGILLTMQVMTTCSWDDHCGWEKTALCMPLSRRSIVKAKYLTLLLLCTAGGLLGALIGGTVGWFTDWVTPDPTGILRLAVSGGIAAGVGLLMGAPVIPLLIRFGTDRARIALLLSAALPAGVLLGLYRLAPAALPVLLPLLLAAWLLGSYLLACRFMAAKDL